MRIIAKSTLKQFYQTPEYRDAKGPLEAWYAEAKHADWETPIDIKNKYRSASILHNNRVVFNIGGNKYRLVVKIHYNTGIVYIRFIGTHDQYNKIDAESI
jgi:mRNA interferase HigB